MSELLSRFRKTFTLGLGFNKWEGRFQSLSAIQQKAVVLLLEKGVERELAFTGVLGVNQNELSLQFDEVTEKLHNELFDDKFLGII